MFPPGPGVAPKTERLCRVRGLSGPSADPRHRLGFHAPAFAQRQSSHFLLQADDKIYVEAVGSGPPVVPGRLWAHEGDFRATGKVGEVRKDAQHKGMSEGERKEDVDRQSSRFGPRRLCRKATCTESSERHV